MATVLGQNKTMQSLELKDSGPFGSGLTQYSAVQQFVKHLLLGVSRNSTLERVELCLLLGLSCVIECEFLWYYSRLTLLFSLIFQ